MSRPLLYFLRIFYNLPPTARNLPKGRFNTPLVRRRKPLFSPALVRKERPLISPFPERPDKASDDKRSPALRPLLHPAA